MKVCVLGLWHLGCVTAACLADIGHKVCGLDFDEDNIRHLQQGKAPLFEPDLDELIEKGLSSESLTFTTDIKQAVGDVDVLWVAYDTPVDDQDRADVKYVMDRVRRVLPALPEGALVVVSSQAPVGSVKDLEEQHNIENPDHSLSFACSPENLRLGKAINAFMEPARIVAGVRDENSRNKFAELMNPVTGNILWMEVESAEMTKHALNAFLATSVAFANEIAELCEQVGADAGDVARGMKSDPRIGSRAYLSPGAAFAGGTLARDIVFLGELGARRDQPMLLVRSVFQSNREHKSWVKRKLVDFLGPLERANVAIWGLTYKPGTDTLRRSTSVELCHWLDHESVNVHAHDPAISKLPEELEETMVLYQDPLEACEGCDALIVATEWPEYRDVESHAVLDQLEKPFVIDVNGFLMDTLGKQPGLTYCRVGRSVQNDATA